MNKTLKLLVTCSYLLNLLIVKQVSVCAAERDTLSYRILFEADSIHVQPKKFDNTATFFAISDCWNTISTDTTITNINIEVYGNASIEGTNNSSASLARSRAFATYAYLYKRYSIPDSLFTVIEGRNALVGTNELLDTLSLENVVEVDIENIKAIVNNTSPTKLRKALLTYDPTGTSWRWFKDNVLEPTRYSEVLFTFDYEPTPPAPDTLVQEVVVAPAVAEPVIVDRAMFRIKTNLLYDLATVPSLGFEFGFAKRFGISFLTTFNHWDFRTNVKFRNLILQPEFRVYLKEGFNGHYFGIDGHYGWYNIAWFDSKTRYQDRDGNTPLWGAGLVYGYVLPFNKHLGLDFSIGGGYANLDYDCFYNIENGKKYTSEKRDYWGLTNVGISFYCKF